MTTTPGQRIRDERIELGWSQQRLAQEISRIKRGKISREAVAQWEIGDSKSQKPENLFAAAKALKLNPQWVMDGTGEKHLESNASFSVDFIPNSVRTEEPTPAESDASIIASLAAQLSDLEREHLIGLLRARIASSQQLIDEYRSPRARPKAKKGKDSLDSDDFHRTTDNNRQKSII